MAPRASSRSSSLMVLVAALLGVLVLLQQLPAARALRGSAAHRRRRAHQKRSFPKYKHHPVSPEDDFFGDEVYPKHLRDAHEAAAAGAGAGARSVANAEPHDPNNPEHNPLGLVPHDWDKYPDGITPSLAEDAGQQQHGRRLTADCADAICQGTVSCEQALSISVYNCENLENLYCPGACTEPTADCGCTVTTLPPQDTCTWLGTDFDTSCSLQTEADCYLTAQEHELAGTSETMNLVLTRRYIDDTCANSLTDSSVSSYPHPLIDLANETDPVATCCFVGQVVDPCFFDYGRTSYSCPYVCTADDILTDTKKAFINERLDWVEQYFATLFRTRPLIEDIEVDVSKESTRRLAGSTGTAATYDSGVHLVVVTTAQPSGIQAGIAGYAIALQSQFATAATNAQLGGSQAEDGGKPAQRVTVGHFNWCPDTIDEAEVNSNFQKGSSNRLAVHELLHLMNAVKTAAAYHANEWGGRTCTDNIYFDSVETWSQIRTRKVITPRALLLGRQQFGCPDMPGLPIENQVIGYGSHWETRCFGPEVLAYGENMGESYISDVTLGFIEDMGFYVANYSAAGRFGEAAAVVAEVQDAGILQAATTGAELITDHTFNSTGFSPGFLRWGRLAGCDFCFGNPKNWPEEYLCREDNFGGCTPDHRMSARCSLNEWGGPASNPQAPSYPKPMLYEPTTSGTWTQLFSTDIGEVSWAGNIPDTFNYLGDSDSEDGVLGGYSDANEYAPVMVGYWNCLDEQPPADLNNLFAAPEMMMPDNDTELSNVTELQDDAAEAADTEDKLDFTDLFSAVSDQLGNIGGQSYGATARCFSSSLVPLTDVYNLDLTFAKNGLCYVANCYSKEYLQVGIKGNTGDKLLYWYGCPAEGGTMYIPGFTGSIQCPVAEDFCFGEDTSGVLYSEIDLTLEWVMWGCIAGVVVITVLVLCIMWKKIDHKVHFCCGVNADQRDWASVMEKRHGPHSCGAWVLTIFSALWLLPGLGLFGFVIYTLLPDTELLWDTQSRQVPVMLVLSLLMIVISCMGIDGIWKPQPSIVLIIFFYLAMVLMLVSIFCCVIPFVLINVIESIAEAQWDGLKHNFPDSWQNYNSSHALNEVQDLLWDNSSLVAAAVIFTLVSEFQAMVCSYLGLTTLVVTRNFEMVMNLVFLASGISVLAVAVPTHRLLHFNVFVTTTVVASGLLITGCIGVVAACQRKEGCFIFYGVSGFFNFFVLVAGGILLLVYGGAFSQSEFVTSAQFCAYEYPFVDCTCALAADPAACPVTSCVNATTLGCGAEIATARAARGYSDLPLDRCLVYNFTGETYSCVQQTEFVSDFQMEGSVSLFLPTLNDTEIAEVAAAYVEAESLDRQTLQAWAETDVTLVGCLLLLLAVFQMILLITNRLIIDWSIRNNWPHGKDPYFLMLHTAAHRHDMRAKMKALSAFKAAGSGFLGFKDAKVAPMSIDQTQRFTVKCGIDPEAFGEGIWGLGMAFEETMVGRRKKVAVQGFRAGEDDDGNEVHSPGLEAGLRIGDIIIQVDGIDLVGGMKELKMEVIDAQHLHEVTLLVERLLVKGRYVPPQPTVHKNGVYPEVTKLVVMRKPREPLGLNISEIFGSGNEGFGLDKAYLVVGGVVGGSAAAAAGLQKNDTVLAVNGRMVFSLDEFKAAMAGTNKVELIVNRMRDNAQGGSFRESNVVDIPVALDPEGIGGVGLGARIIEVTSGIGVDSSVPFLMVSALNNYTSGQPGPAAKSGIKMYDLVLMVNNISVNSLKQLVVALRNGERRPVFTVRRLAFEFGNKSVFAAGANKALQDVALTVTRAANQGLGVALNEAYRNGETDPFVVVTSVRAGSAAESAGVQEQDLFMEIDGVDIFSIDDVRAAMQGKATFQLRVQRFGLAPSSAGGITADNFWDITDDLFDRIDTASGGRADGFLSVRDLQKYFSSRGGAGSAQRYIDNMDGYATGADASPDGKISRDEWYAYFDFLAEEDTGVAETSPAAYSALRDMTAAN